MNKGAMIATLGALWFVLAIAYALLGSPTEARSGLDVHSAVAFF